MKELAAAICIRFNSGPMVTSFTGIYNTVAPNDSVFPYLVFTMISQSTDWTFTERFERYLIQFDIYSEEISPVQIGNLYNLLLGNPGVQQGFDFAEFAVSGHTLLWCIRESSSLQRWEIEGKKVWNYTVTYDVMLERQP